MEMSEAQAFCFQKWNTKGFNALYLSCYQTNRSQHFCFQAAQIFLENSPIDFSLRSRQFGRANRNCLNFLYCRHRKTSTYSPINLSKVSPPSHSQSQQEFGSWHANKYMVKVYIFSWESGNMVRVVLMAWKLSSDSWSHNILNDMHHLHTFIK